MQPPNSDEIWYSAEHAFAPDHPTAAGHFPGKPVIPGSVVLDHVLRAISGAGTVAVPVELRLAKFFRAIRPGEHLSIRWQRRGGGNIMFECWRADSGGLALAGWLRFGGAG